MEPRGCLDLDHFREVQCKDSTLILKIPDCDAAAESSNNTIILEAQTEEDAELWAQSMSSGRFMEMKDRLSAEFELRQSLESELARTEAQVASLTEYASERHETAMALQGERQLRRNLIEELDRLAESLQASSFDSDSDMRIHHPQHSTAGNGGKGGDETQRASLATIAMACNSIQCAATSAVASEQKAKEAMNNHELALERIFQVEEELKHTKQLLVETQRSESQLRGRLGVLGSNAKYMEGVQSKMASELAEMRQNIKKVRREKSILAKELRAVRSTSPQQTLTSATSKDEEGSTPPSENNNVISSYDSGKVPDYNHHHGRRRQQQQHIIVEMTGSEFQYDASAFRSLVRQRLRHRICYSGTVGGMPPVLENNLVNCLTDGASSMTTTVKSRCVVPSTPPLIQVCDLETAPGIHVEESESNIPYELTFVTEQIGLQFEITEDKQILVSGRKGFIHPLSVRPRLGTMLVACNGKNIIGDTCKEISLILKVAGRPLRLQFIEEHHP